MTDDENEGEYFAEEVPQEVPQESIPDIPIQRQLFTKEDLKNQFDLRNTKFRKDLHISINNALLSQRCKRELRRIVDNYLSSNRFLTNLPESRYGNGVLATALDLEHDLIYVVAASFPSDIRNPAFIGIVNAITTHFRITAYRSIGKTRERLVNQRSDIRQEIINEGSFTSMPPAPSMQPQMQPPKKKSFLSFLGD